MSETKKMSCNECEQLLNEIDQLKKCPLCYNGAGYCCYGCGRSRGIKVLKKYLLFSDEMAEGKLPPLESCGELYACPLCNHDGWWEQDDDPLARVEIMKEKISDRISRYQQTGQLWEF